MPLTAKGEKIKSAMEKTYGPEKGEQVFYASKQKKSITGVDRKDAENTPALEAQKAGKEEKRQQASQAAGEHGEADLPTQLKDAEASLQELEREQEQVTEGQERQNAIDDTKGQIRALRDQIKNQARAALGKPTNDDSLEDLERKDDGALLMKHISDACDNLSSRMDAFENKKKDYAAAQSR